MQKDFWHRRWAKDEIGFHLNKVNPLLKKHWGKLNSSEGDSVFVPLCGKSIDLLWLVQQGLNVVGIELSQKAVEDFFQEQDLQATITEHEHFIEYRYENIRILCGDLFLLNREDIGECQFIYDRACLIAFPAEMRTAYVEKLQQLFPNKTRSLLITLEYPQELMDGPPFSILREEVEHLFAPLNDIECLQAIDILESSPRFKDKGLPYFIEPIFVLEKR